MPGPHTPDSGHHSDSRDPKRFSGAGSTPEEKALIRAVEKVGGKSVEGQLDPRICEQTRAYADKMASQQAQDNHAGSDERFHAIGGGAASEITAESWGSEHSIQQHADECVHSWLQSPAHAPALTGYHDRFCYSMAQGSNGSYYCTGLFAEGGMGTTESSSGSDEVPHNRLLGSRSRHTSH
jgi:hypothetical protein